MIDAEVILDEMVRAWERWERENTEPSRQAVRAVILRYRARANVNGFDPVLCAFSGCGRSFVPYQRHNKFCSQRCRQAHDRSRKREYHRRKAREWFQSRTPEQLAEIRRMDNARRRQSRAREKARTT